MAFCLISFCNYYSFPDSSCKYIRRCYSPFLERELKKQLHRIGINMPCCAPVYYKTLSSTQTRTKSLTDADLLHVYSRRCAPETPALH